MQAIIITEEWKEKIEIARSIILAFLYGKRGDWFTSKQITMALSESLGAVLSLKYTPLDTINRALTSLRDEPPNGSSIRFQYEENTNRQKYKYRIRQPRWYEDAIKERERINSK